MVFQANSIIHDFFHTECFTKVKYCSQQVTNRLALEVYTIVHGRFHVENFCMHTVLFGQVSFGMVANGSSMQYLKNSNRPLQKRLWSIINSHGNQLLVKNVNEGAMRVQSSDGTYALIVEGINYLIN